jgi:hypothetical protein
MAKREASTARKLTPSAKKHHPSPIQAITTPAMDGPRRRAALNMEELRAMAFARFSFSSTREITKDWRQGISKALMTPWRALSPISHPTVILPPRARAARAKD